MTDEELKAEMTKAAIDLSYYNAAEGGSWSQEREGRMRAQARWDDLVHKARVRGIWNREDWRGYLI